MNNAPLNLTLKLLWTLVVNFMPLGIPMAFLVGVLVGFSRLSGDSEIVAMKAGGMSLPRISIPVFILAILVSLMSLFLNREWAPWSERASRQTLMKIGSRKFTASINEGTFSSGFFNLLLYTEKANSRAGRMENVFIFDERDPKHPLSVVSKTGELIRVQSSEDDLGGVVLQLQDGSIHQANVSGVDDQKMDFGVYQIFFDIPDRTGSFGFRPRLFDQGQILSELEDPKQLPERVRDLKTEYWRRLAVAITPFFFVFLGIGFGTVRTRGARAGVLLVAFVTMAVYWQVQVTSIWLGERGALPPWFAVEIPNLMILLVGGVMFKRACW
ncbi:MAG: YjgP/YjgQ family permease [Proteobacteria bacterium]|nr:YjgP/YjgQ family permease [Pseudomonadota bacterium]